MFVPDSLPAPLVPLLDGVQALVDDPAVAQAGPAERAAWLSGTRQLIDAAEALFTTSLAAFDANGDGETLHGARSTASWLRGALKLADGDASERVRLARDSRTLMAEPVSALGQGQVTYDQVRAISKAVTKVPEPMAPEAVHVLTDLAKQADVNAVRVAGRALRHVLDPDGALKDSEKQFDHRYLNLSPMLDGMTAVDGILDAESAAMVSAALTPFLVPTCPTDTRSAGQRRADGLVELARAAADHTLLPEIAGQRPHLNVICPVETLSQHNSSASGTPDKQTPGMGAPPARLPDCPGGPGLLTSTAAARIACDADVNRVVLDEDSIPIEYGRTKRLFTSSQRRALALRDGGCRFPDCSRPPAFTDAHHVVAWLNGGLTNLANGCLLCRYHHRQVHEGGWRIEQLDPLKGAGAQLVFHGPDNQRLTSDPRGP